MERLKTNYILCIVICIFSIFFSGCKIENESLELSTRELSFSSEENSAVITSSCGVGVFWIFLVDKDGNTLTKKYAENGKDEVLDWISIKITDKDRKITVSVKKNDSTEARYANVEITNDEVNLMVKIVQDGAAMHNNRAAF
ncbi:MAG: hypothetical protein LKK16_07095 [Bacteroidales bacterium]|jgi:hypothetical protein|nr:BACON domain-containing protein [Bacteroidales bacterium]MCH3941748.1 hypothetical protein [Bacteroidales bacterium]MCI2136068.1 hypothetical protein [Bacteroidales bacterium]MCI5720750.1 hypothetical protein [Bacteroidales bacterium]MDY6377972.1 BACON domain-containing carbohydrate-binding protein [Bacteroidales bacterium]